MEAQQRVPRRGHHGGEARQRLDGRHHALRHPASARLLHALRHVAIAAQAQTRQRERQAVEIATEALASELLRSERGFADFHLSPAWQNAEIERLLTVA